MTEREPDLGEDAREQDTGEGGYPETQPPGHDPSGGEGGAGGGTGAGSGSGGAPGTRSPDEGEAGQATGNPDAAG